MKKGLVLRMLHPAKRRIYGHHGHGEEREDTEDFDEAELQFEVELDPGAERDNILPVVAVAGGVLIVEPFG